MNHNQQITLGLQKQLEKPIRSSRCILIELEHLKQQQQESTLESDQIKRDLKKRLDQLDERCVTISQLKDEVENRRVRASPLWRKN